MWELEPQRKTCLMEWVFPAWVAMFSALFLTRVLDNERRRCNKKNIYSELCSTQTTKSDDEMSENDFLSTAGEKRKSCNCGKSFSAIFFVSSVPRGLLSLDFICHFTMHNEETVHTKLKVSCLSFDISMSRESRMNYEILSHYFDISVNRSSVSISNSNLSSATSVKSCLRLRFHSDLCMRKNPTKRNDKSLSCQTAMNEWRHSGK